MSYRKALLLACAAVLQLAIAAPETARANCHEGWVIPYPGGHTGGCPPKVKIKPKAVNVGLEKSGGNKPVQQSGQGAQTGAQQGAAGALKKTKLTPQPKPKPGGTLGIHEVDKPASSKDRRGFHEVDKPAARDQSAVGFNPQPDPMLTRGVIDPNQTRGYPSGGSGTGRGVPPR